MAKISIIDQERWKTRIKLEETAAKCWEGKWGWILEENEKVHKQLEEISKESLILKQLERKVDPDPRTILPIPETVNAQYGWIANKPEFRLQIFGPDVLKPEPYRDKF